MFENHIEKSGERSLKDLDHVLDIDKILDMFSISSWWHSHIVTFLSSSSRQKGYDSVGSSSEMSLRSKYSSAKSLIVYQRIHAHRDNPADKIMVGRSRSTLDSLPSIDSSLTSACVLVWCMAHWWSWRLLQPSINHSYVAIKLEAVHGHCT